MRPRHFAWIGCVLATLTGAGVGRAEVTPDKTHFVADPVSDTAVIALSLGFAGITQAVITNGELKPQQPGSRDSLLGIDRWAVDQHDPNAGRWSAVGLYAVVLYAVVDPVLTGVREHDAHAFVVDLVLYAESVAVTSAFANLAKLAVRRPRPFAYAEREALVAKYGDKAPEITDTDASLSFFSEHVANMSAITATATYLAFARAPSGSLRPWLTLAGGTLLTGFTAYERVRAGYHFPTDVFAGALVGAAIGVLVPHLHREQTAKEQTVLIGLDMPRGGAVATLTVAY